MSKRTLGLLLVALAQLTCAGALFTAPPNSSITLFANPPFIVANGGVSVISAFVVEPAGTVVPDGTVVQFFTTLGRIDPQGKTRDGVARVNLVADSRSGAASVTAVSGGPAAQPSASPSPGGTGTSGGSNSATITVDIGSALPARTVVTADPTRITRPRYSLITANVYDQNGNPVANVPVIFTVAAAGTSALESNMDSGGRPIYTDTNGRAQDFLVTQAPNDGVQRTVEVTATPAGNAAVAGSVTVAIN